MKRRNGFVSNSSSSSFIVAFRRDQYVEEESFFDKVSEIDPYSRRLKLHGISDDFVGFDCRDIYGEGLYFGHKTLTSVYKLRNMKYNVYQLDVDNHKLELMEMIIDSEYNFDNVKKVLK